MFTDRYKRSAGIIFFAMIWVAIAAEAARGRQNRKTLPSAMHRRAAS